jgi:type I restriction enzyme, S subunit
VGLIVSAADAAEPEVPERYKVSDVGVIPDDWDVVPLSELLDFRNGVNADKNAYGHGIRFINVLEVITKSHLTAEDVPGRVALSGPAIKAYAVRRGDVLFNRTSETQEEVGLAAVYEDDEPLVFGGFVIRGRPVTSRLDGEYCGYGLRSAAVRQQIVKRGQGAIRANIGQADLRQVLAPLPPAAEQRAIAGALSNADELIGRLDRLIKKKRAVKAAVMHELLSGATRLSGFAGEWEMYRLGEIGAFFKGRGIKRGDISTEGLPCIRYGEIYTRYDNYATGLASRIPLSVTAQAQPIAQGDLLFAASGETSEEIGKCVAYVGDEVAYAGGDIIGLRLTGHDPLYLGHLLNHGEIAQQKARFGQGDAVVHISAARLGELAFRLPSLREQQAIARVLLDIDEEIVALECRVAQTRAVAQGMKQALLSGRVRLPQEALAT